MKPLLIVQNNGRERPGKYQQKAEKEVKVVAENMVVIIKAIIMVMMAAEALTWAAEWMRRRGWEAGEAAGDAGAGAAEELVEQDSEPDRMPRLQAE